jgi:hypothetical protein
MPGLTTFAAILGDVGGRRRGDDEERTRAAGNFVVIDNGVKS